MNDETKHEGARILPFRRREDPVADPVIRFLEEIGASLDDPSVPPEVRAQRLDVCYEAAIQEFRNTIMQPPRSRYDKGRRRTPPAGEERRDE